MSDQLFAMSLQQKCLWQRRGSRRAVRVALRLQGPLVIARLERAFDAWVAHHEIARTALQPQPGFKLPFQLIRSRVPITWHEEACSAPSADAVIRRFLDEEQASEQALEPRLLSLSADRHVLLLAISRLFCDEQSLPLLVADLGRLYAGDSLEDPLQYADYVTWQEDNLGQEAEVAAATAYLAALDRLPRAAFTCLPARTPPEEGFRAAFTRRELTRRQATRLAELARRMDGDPANAVFACLCHLLVRLGHGPDWVVGYAWDGRGFADLEQAVGPFEMCLPLPVQERRHGSLEDQLTRFEKNLALLEEHRDALDPGAGVLPYEVVCRRLPGPVDSVRDGVRFGPCEVTADPEQFHLRLDVVGNRSLVLAYNAGTYTPETAALLLARLVVLLDAALLAPSTALDDLAILTAPERERWLLEFNLQPPVNAPDVVACFEEHVRRQGGAPAVICDQEELTYAELNQRVNALAHHLLSLGAGFRGEEVVAVNCERGVLHLVALLAVLKTGAAYTPLDPALPEARRAAILRDTRCRLVIAEQAVEGPGIQTVAACHPIVAGEPTTNPGRPRDPRALAYVLFTSGSTGEPKGVAVANEQMNTYVSGVAERLALQAGHHCGLISTLNADLGYTMLFPSLARGACLHLLTYHQATDPDRLRAHVSRWPLDFLKIVPSHLSGLIADQDIASLLPRRALILGGESCSASLYQRLRQAAPEMAIFNHYGPSETTVGVMALEITGLEPLVESPLPLGRPLPGDRVYLLSETGQPVAPGMPGELCLAGNGLARGYFNRPAQTAAAFLPYPSAELPAATPGARLYRSGDLARFNERGLIDFLGRSDHQVKIRGFRVELGEIEAILAGHDLLRDVVVAVHRENETTLKLIAYLVPRRGPDELVAAAVRDFARQVLPDFMQPTYYVLLTSLPLNANGKVDRSRLPGPNPQGSAAPAYLAPRNSVERALCEVWAVVLGLERVGIQDNFFHLGGDSIQCIQVVARLKKKGYLVQVKEILDAQTVARLAPLAQQVTADGSAESGLTAIALDETQRAAIARAYPGLQTAFPLSPVQEGMLFHSLYEQSSRAYLEQKILDLQGRLQPEVLRAAWTSTVHRHQALRAAFVWSGLDRPLQVVQEHVPLPWTFADWSGDAREEQSLRFQTFLAEDRARGFTLEAAPLLRVALIKLAGDRFRLVWSHHHLILDGWSVPLILEDLLHAYGQLTAGGQPDAAPGPDYHPFIAWLQGRDAGRAEAYWRGRLAGYRGSALLTRGVAGDVVTSDVYTDARAALDEAVVAGLRSWAKANKLTLNTIVQAAWCLALAELGQVDDVVFGATVSGRPPQLDQVDRTVGLFINTLPVRLRITPQTPLLAWLGDHQQRQFEAGEFEHASLANIQKWCRPTGGLDLFDHLLVFENYPGLPGRDLVGELTLSILESEALEKTNYPALFQVTLNENMGLRLMFDARHLAAARAGRALQLFALFLRAFPQHERATVSDLVASALQADDAQRQAARAKKGAKSFRQVKPKAVARLEDGVAQ